MSLLLRKAEVLVHKTVHNSETGQGAMEACLVHGKECNLMVATRLPGYHTRPHRHECEQINYVMEGEIWFFVEETGYHCRAGDFQRIPRGKVHWAWNRSGQPARVIEAHAPPLVGGKQRGVVTGLFDAGESTDVPDAADNLFVEYDAATVEARYPGA